MRLACLKRSLPLGSLDGLFVRVRMRPTARLLLLNRPEDRYCCVIVLLLAVLTDSGVFARCPVMLSDSGG